MTADRLSDGHLSAPQSLHPLQPHDGRELTHGERHGLEDLPAVQLHVNGGSALVQHRHQLAGGRNRDVLLLGPGNPHLHQPHGHPDLPTSQRPTRTPRQISEQGG